MKTTFSFFPGMFKNPALAVKTTCKLEYYFKKLNKKVIEYQLFKYKCVETLAMIIDCNISNDLFELS